MTARHRSTGDDETDVAVPDLTIVHGDPTPEELAAIAAVLTAVAREAAEADALASRPGHSAWDRNSSRLRQDLAPGPGAWRGFSG